MTWTVRSRAFLIVLALLVGALVVVSAVAHARLAERRRAAALVGPDAEGWFRLQRGYPTGRVPPADALDRAFRATRPAPGTRPALQLPGDRWVSVGPQGLAVGGSLPFEGRVTAIAPHPTIATTLYAGTDSGGIWKTTDGGVTWLSLTDSLPVPAIESLAIDPVDPRLVYAATTNRTYATRWLRSTDGGVTWTASAIVTDQGQALSPVLCSVNVFKACIPPSSGRILIDPRRAGSPNTSTVYYVATSHLLRSDDSGRTFHAVLSLPTDLDFAGPDAAARNPEAEYLRDVALDPTRPDRLVAAIAQPRCLDGPCGTMTSVVGVYRTFDGGAHWSRQDLATISQYSLVNTRYADPGAVYVPRVRVAIAPSGPDTLAVAFRDEQLSRPRVLVSVDAGDHFAETAPPATSLTWPLGLVFAPTDANTLYVSSNLVYRTTDLGRTWTTISNNHSDNIALTFDAGGTLLIGGDGGIYKAPANGGVSALHGTLSITEFYSIAVHPTNPFLFAGGTQDNGTALFQGPAGWSSIIGGDGGDVVFDPTSAAPVLYGEVEWYFDRGSNVFVFARCQLGSCAVRMTGIDLSLDGAFIPRMALDASSPATLWLAVEKLFRTDNRADSWVAASPSVAGALRCWQDPVSGRSCANARYFTAVAVAPTNSQAVYAGTLNGDVLATTDRGATWRSVAGPDAGPLPVRPVNEVIVDPLNTNTAYVAYSGFDSNGSGRGHVFRTTDGGQTWQDITGTLPDVPVNTLLIDPDSVATSSPRVLYAGTDIGVFRVTLDGTTNWQAFGSGLPPVVVNRLSYNAATRQLFAATYGRGLWVISSRYTR
ncbi:MAG TPA: hypothetical protein VLT86_13220 [Vicinamibacterales bacterium]|nr:hypothetical protein [Vicinamibacterales bacterium]